MNKNQGYQQDYPYRQPQQEPHQKYDYQTHQNDNPQYEQEQHAQQRNLKNTDNQSHDLHNSQKPNYDHQTYDMQNHSQDPLHIQQHNDYNRPNQENLQKQDQRRLHQNQDYHQTVNIHNYQQDYKKQNTNSEFEIIRQGYGISQPMKASIIKLFMHSHSQTEYKNPADYIKHNLDSQYGPFWFVFMWEDRKNQTAQYSYYNNDDRVIEFRASGQQVLIYSFIQEVEKKEVQNLQYCPADQRAYTPYHNQPFYPNNQVPDYYTYQQQPQRDQTVQEQYQRYPYPSQMYRQNPSQYI